MCLLPCPLKGSTMAAVSAVEVIRSPKRMKPHASDARRPLMPPRSASPAPRTASSTWTGLQAVDSLQLGGGAVGGGGGELGTRQRCCWRCLEAGMVARSSPAGAFTFRRPKCSPDFWPLASCTCPLPAIYTAHFETGFPFSLLTSSLWLGRTGRHGQRSPVRSAPET